MSKPDDTKPRLSGLVVAHNEAENLAECLGGLVFCDELVVLLDRCTDSSKEIAGEFTKALVEGAWPQEADRRNAALASCTGEWILEIDADERVPPDLAAEIRQVIERPEHPVYLVPVDNYVGRRLVRYGWGGSFGVGSRAMLFRSGVKSYSPGRVHCRLTWAQGVSRGRLENRLTHYVDRDISDMIARLNHYSSAYAADLRASGDIGSAFHNYRRIVTRFWKCFVMKKGYKEGGLGFLIALCAGLYPILSYLKARYEDD